MDQPKKTRKEQSGKCSNLPHEDPARNDFNEEQMSTDRDCGPVETEPVKPDHGRDPAHIPGVASS